MKEFRYSKAINRYINTCPTQRDASKLNEQKRKHGLTPNELNAQDEPNEHRDDRMCAIILIINNNEHSSDPLLDL